MRTAPLRRTAAIRAIVSVLPHLFVPFLIQHACRSREGGDTWEAIKLNQCAGVYLEGCEAAGAGDNAIDMVAVQYGHVLRSAIHDANWCFYVKASRRRGMGGSGRVFCPLCVVGGGLVCRAGGRGAGAAFAVNGRLV